MFKPLLIPNNKGEDINWHDRIQNPSDWWVMPKRDGVRLEISATTVKGRSLKEVTNKHILNMVRTLQKSIATKNWIFEGEFYSHEMTFPEIIHFFKTEDITSYKTKVKYEKLWEKTKGDPAKGWKYPGRDVKWLTTWPKSLRVHLFDVYTQEEIYAEASQRLALCAAYSTNQSYVTAGPFRALESIEDLHEVYKSSLEDGFEGLVLMHKKGLYKTGRATLKEATIFKMKEDNLEFDGEIIGLIQATEVNEGIEKTINELGRGVTSKKIGDRHGIEAISNFLVRMDDGKELKIGLRGWNDQDKQNAWKVGLDYYKGKWIKFTGMKPVKVGGVPRHSYFQSFRDSK